YIEELDFGPRKKGTPRDPFFDFGTGGLGTPEGDVNKYYMLSHDEWDYDQIYTASIGSSDPRWLEPPPELAPDLSDGYDTKVLLSFGPVDLQPDSSVRFLYAMFTADDVHLLPTNGGNLPLNPDQYLAGLNFDEVLLNAERAGDLAEILTDPMLPVLGLRLIAQGQDTASIRWDPWVFNNINGYEIFLSDIPVENIPYPGVVPPWLMTPDPDPHASVGAETDYTFTSLKQDDVYYTKVAHRMPSEVGQTSDPLLIDFRNFSPPIAESEAVYYSPDCSPDGPVKCENLPRIEWSPPDQVSVDRYNIYRFADSASLLERYSPFYDFGECLGILDPKEIFIIDDDTIYFYAMDTYGEVGSDMREFVDEDPIDGAYYIVTSVDRNGLESHFSEPVIAYEISNFQQDILVLTNLAAFWSKTDSIRVFYEDILAGYDFDIYSVHDTASKYGCWVRLEECIHWQDFTDYKLLILDEDSWNPFFSESFEDKSGAMTNYLCSGGKLAYFGGFEGFNNYDRYLAQTYTAQYDFIQQFFGIDNIFYYGLGFYGLPFPCAPNLDTCFGFVEAESVLPSWPSVYYDQSRDPFFMVNCYWLLDSPPCVATFDVNDGGRVSHVYRSIYPQISWIEGDPVGVKTTTTEAETYLFGFHLWYMQRESGEQLIDGIFKGIVPGGKEKVLAQVPDKFGLNQNYPNPFNPTTVLSFNLPKPAKVTLEIFNILGQRVNTLIHGEQRQAGLHQVEWHGDNAAGDKVGSGIYFYRLRADDEVATRKMMLLK
ncbi:MAG: T9SS type A sorting domain-containing protein, partial [Candidatus Zixiibacteriota bacterium]